MSVFNEFKLGKAIKSQWGQHGAHAEVYRDLLAKVSFLESQIDTLINADKMAKYWSEQTTEWICKFNKQVEKVGAQAEYIALLEKAYNETFTIASVHHYKPDQKDVQKGIELREIINKLSTPSPLKVEEEKTHVLCAHCNHWIERYTLCEFCCPKV